MEECFKKMSLKRTVASIVWECNRQHNKQVVNIIGNDLLCLQQSSEVTNDDHCWLKDKCNTAITFLKQYNNYTFLFQIVNSYIVLICNSIKV